jgi:hypothetical protein
MQQQCQDAYRCRYVTYLGKLYRCSNLPMRLGLSLISSLKTTSDNHRKAVTHENSSKSSIGMIHMTNLRQCQNAIESTMTT